MLYRVNVRGGMDFICIRHQKIPGYFEGANVFAWSQGDNFSIIAVRQVGEKNWVFANIAQVDTHIHIINRFAYEYVKINPKRLHHIEAAGRLPIEH